MAVCKLFVVIAKKRLVIILSKTLNKYRYANKTQVYGSFGACLYGKVLTHLDGFDKKWSVCSVSTYALYYQLTKLIKLVEFQ